MLLFGSGIAVDRSARKAHTAKAANVAFRFMREQIRFGSRFTCSWTYRIIISISRLRSEILFSLSQINTGGEDAAFPGYKKHYGIWLRRRAGFAVMLRGWVFGRKTKRNSLRPPTRARCLHTRTCVGRRRRPPVLPPGR